MKRWAIIPKYCKFTLEARNAANFRSEKFSSSNKASLNKKKEEKCFFEKLKKKESTEEMDKLQGFNMIRDNVPAFINVFYELIKGVNLKSAIVFFQ